MSIPYRTRQLLEDICRSFPREAYRGAKAIDKYITDNFEYGANENVSQERWVRWPHQVKKLMNCNDKGIYAYLMAEHMGLDCSLARFENFRGLSQSHLSLVVRGSRKDYVVDGDGIEEFNLCPDKDNKRQRQASFDKVTYMDVSDVCRNIEFSKNKNGLLKFVETGQLFRKYYGIARLNDVALPFSVVRGFGSKDGEFLWRKVFTLPGFNIVMDMVSDETKKVRIAQGYDNMTTQGGVPLCYIRRDDITLVDQTWKVPMKKKKKLDKRFHTMMFMTGIHDTATRMNKDLVDKWMKERNPNLYSKEQWLLKMHLYLSVEYVKNHGDRVYRYNKKHRLYPEEEVGFYRPARLLYCLANKADTESRIGERQRKLGDKMKKMFYSISS